jgi:soluble lytic murein transglycosylase-like protein
VAQKPTAIIKAAILITCRSRFGRMVALDDVNYYQPLNNVTEIGLLRFVAVSRAKKDILYSVISVAESEYQITRNLRYHFERQENFFTKNAKA